MSSHIRGTLLYCRFHHDAGAANWATIASLVDTCNHNAIEPHAYLTQTLLAIFDGHKQSQIDALLPSNYAAKV